MDASLESGTWLAMHLNVVNGAWYVDAGLDNRNWKMDSLSNLHNPFSKPASMHHVPPSFPQAALRGHACQWKNIASPPMLWSIRKLGSTDFSAGLTLVSLIAESSFLLDNMINLIYNLIQRDS